ncbi:MAG TPA: mercury(II) reductase [Desulfobulbus sp.]|nr:mercury(II) reductase [Desulfobulbus sp.]
MNDSTTEEKYDLVLIGSGSASFAAAIRASELGKQVAMIEQGTLGGTCVNVGCVPSKTLIRAAQSKFQAEHSPFKGINQHPVSVDFSTLIQEKDALVETLRQAKYQDVLQAHENITLIRGKATFISPSEIRVGNRLLTGHSFLIATGAEAWIPPVPGLAQSGFLTSTTLFELQQLPSSMVVIGGRAIALELGQMMQRLGCRVTILQRSGRILPDEDPDLTEELTALLTGEGVDILTGVQLQNVHRDTSFQVEFIRKGKPGRIEAEQLLVATGRRPATTDLALEQAGVELNPDFSIKTDKYCRTTVPNIYAAGDVTGNPAYVYTAAYEGKLAVENAFGKKQEKDFSILPYVVFTDPQVGRIGLNEQMAGQLEIDVDVAVLPLKNVPRALAARDTRGFIKLLRKKGGDQLLGASILAPEGGELLMEVALAMQYTIPVPALAEMFHPYLTLGEAIKLAAQTFDKDVKKLSCCAA